MDPNGASDKFLLPLKRLRLQLRINISTNLIMVSLTLRSVTRERPVLGGRLLEEVKHLTYVENVDIL
jgi:hypothetical protein